MLAALHVQHGSCARISWVGDFHQSLRTGVLSACRNLRLEQGNYHFTG